MHTWRHCVGLGLAGVLACGPWGLALAQENTTAIESNAPSRSSAELVEYGGLVLAQVLTSLGQHFHTKFAEGWSTQRDAESYVLSVRERLSPKVGTEIQVWSADVIVFRAVLPRSYSAVAALSESAVEQVHNTVVQTSLQDLLFDDPDRVRSGL